MLVIAVFGATTSVSAAEISVVPPCNGAAPVPSYAVVGAAPNVQVWSNQTLPDFPARAACLGWTKPDFKTLIAVSGSIRSAEDVEGLLERFGAISKLSQVHYWSTTDQAWRPLVMTATALTKNTGGEPRKDFRASELETGKDVYVAEKDSRGASEVIYRMRVREYTHQRFVVETENLTPMRFLGFTLFKPGELSALYFIEKPSGGICNYYALTRIGSGSWLIPGHEKSYVNRAVALFRNFANIPTELEPPPAK